MDRITADSLISEVLACGPDVLAVFERRGLGCPSCLAAGMETVSAVASMHEVPLDDLLDELNGVRAEPGEEP